MAITLVAGGQGQYALAAPTGGVVIKGGAQIASDGNTTKITQTSPRAWIFWDKFNVAASEAVEFIVPENGATLNKIRDANGPSLISGRVSSNGSLYFVNQNGFVFGPESSVTAKNLVVTTQNLNFEHFMDSPSLGEQRFEPSSVTNAKITLAGKVELAENGVAAFIGPVIEATRQANITAPHGLVALTAMAVTKFNFDDPKIDPANYGGNILQHSVKNEGVLTAAGGRVILAASGSKEGGGQSPLKPLVINNGLLDSGIATGKGGTVTLVAINGVISLGTGDIKTGANGGIIYHQFTDHADVVVDDHFLKTINFGAGVNLEISSNRDIFINSNLQASRSNRLILDAKQGVVLNQPVGIGTFVVTAKYFKALERILVGSGGLTVTTSGESGSRNAKDSLAILVKFGADKNQTSITTTDDGNITFTANQGGRIVINNPIISHDFAARAGGIAVLANLTGVDISLHAVNRADIWVESEIYAKNIKVVADNGSIDFWRKIYAFDLDGKTGNLDVEVKSGTRAIEFHDQILATNVRVASDYSNIYFDQPIVSNDASHLPQKIELAGHGFTSFRTAIGVRPGGIFDANVGKLFYTDILANNAASIAITITDPHSGKMVEDNWREKKAAGISTISCYNPMSCSLSSSFGGQNFYVSLVLDDHIKFDHAQSAYFKANGGIDVYSQVTAHNFTLLGLQNRFMGQSSVAVGAGGTISLTEYLPFNYTGALVARLGGADAGGANLSIASYGDLHLLAPIDAGPGRSVTLAGRHIFLVGNVSLSNGKITLIYNNALKGFDGPLSPIIPYTDKQISELPPGLSRIDAVFDQNTYNHLKFFGDANIVVQSYGNLTVTGEGKHFTTADFAAFNQGALTINSEIKAKRHLSFTADDSIFINQPAVTEDGYEDTQVIYRNDGR